MQKLQIVFYLLYNCVIKIDDDAFKYIPFRIWHSEEDYQGGVFL